MNVKDFIALATALAAAKRLEKVDSSQLWSRRVNGEYTIDSEKTMKIARECNALALDLVEVLEEAWEAELTVDFGGHKEKEDEPFFDDPEKLSPIEKIGKELENIEDSLSHGRNSIGGSLLRLATVHGS